MTIPNDVREAIEALMCDAVECLDCERGISEEDEIATVRAWLDAQTDAPPADARERYEREATRADECDPLMLARGTASGGWA